MTDPRPTAPTVLVVMGVSGSGKSTVAALLAERLGWTFADGDDFHTPDSIARMRDGHPRRRGAPTLARPHPRLDRRPTRGRRECGRRLFGPETRLSPDPDRCLPRIRLVFLEGSRELIQDRIRARHGHFMPATLLDSQFAALEPPGPDEDPITVGIEEGPDAIVAAVATRLGIPAGDICG
ncbi:gluconokinase [Methylorubrum aminovorans]|nr:gluconokinase [Methylorubrum aminovorans]